jgi:hypothetical protein
MRWIEVFTDMKVGESKNYVHIVYSVDGQFIWEMYSKDKGVIEKLEKNEDVDPEYFDEIDVKTIEEAVVYIERELDDEEKNWDSDLVARQVVEGLLKALEMLEEEL